jgi:hypothetical protein
VRFVFRRDGELSHAAQAFLDVARRAAPAPSAKGAAEKAVDADQATFQPET